MLDQQTEKTSQLDIAKSLADCEIIYDSFWTKLDVLSQKYLVMANYLCNLFENDRYDFSPSVVEFGRAVESELLCKIFSGFVHSLIGHAAGMVDSGNRYHKLKIAIHSLDNSGSFYLPARAMVKYLTYLSNPSGFNDYNDSLKNFLMGQGINSVPISEATFTDTADEIFDKYRNAAAHPGCTMAFAEAEACSEKTYNVLECFMNAVS